MIFECYQILYKIFAKSAYANLALNSGLKSANEKDKKVITRIVYGVIEKNLFLDYVIKKLTKKYPHFIDAVILKMGVYQIYFMDEPDYAVVNNMVELAKKLKRSPSFINAVLRKCKSVELPKDEYERKSLEYNVPVWAIKEVEKDYGVETAEQFFSHPKQLLTHIRRNPRKINREEFEKHLDFNTDTKTAYGYYVCHNTLRKLNSIDNSLFTVQSLGSMAVCMAAEVKDGYKVLDVCAAPGGKSVFLRQLADISLISCDIHPHRLELINSYKNRMGETDIQVIQNDAAVFRPEWENKFDVVLCDVPCSGLGVLGSRADIFEHKTLDNIEELTELQLKIISTSAKYVKQGGHLIYSTCTILKRENQDIVDKFLSQNPDFIAEPVKVEVDSMKIGDYVQLMPHISNTDGFFIAKVRRK
ncbi:MAG TPA: 16S rRNA (cytosine(967)-C(5))-methyltransferase RsmB [Clostridia bacterium]